MNKNPVIIGAGLAGLLCACAFPDAMVFEAGSPIQQHRALLRFRDDSVSRLTGVPFRSVQVHKEIWHREKVYSTCSNAHANMYAVKVTGRAIGRSIRSLDTVTRHVAPDDFYQTLIDRFAKNITWNEQVNGSLVDTCRERDIPIISTAPMNVNLNLAGVDFSSLQFRFDKKPITVLRLPLNPALVDIYQTIYYPGDDTPIYRASITGSLLIIELISEPDEQFHSLMADEVLDHFGLSRRVRFPDDDVECVEQKYGKIQDIDRGMREALLHELTRDHGIYSVGRFATWRNILLDDVVKDIDHVARLINASAYGRALIGPR
jgi:hypothetical protein